MEHNPKLKEKTIKLIEENIGINLHDFGLDNGFLDLTPKAQGRKEKKRYEFHQNLKQFCAPKIYCKESRKSIYRRMYL